MKLSRLFNSLVVVALLSAAPLFALSVAEITDVTPKVDEPPVPIRTTAPDYPAELQKKKVELDKFKQDADSATRQYDSVYKRLKDIELSGLLRVPPQPRPRDDFESSCYGARGLDIVSEWSGRHCGEGERAPPIMRLWR